MAVKSSSLIETTAWKTQRPRHKWAISLLVRLIGLWPRSFCTLFWTWSDMLQGRAAWLIRYGILKKLARRCGERVSFERGCVIRHWDNLEIGNDVCINEHCNINAAGGIRIGNDVAIAHQSTIVSANHTWDDPRLTIPDNPVRLSATIIEDDVWIGCGCRILAGVTIGPRSIVGAGAVVSRDVPPGWLVGGIPARPIKEIMKASENASKEEG